jgi:PAS domain S-box-containing protein
MHESAHYDKYHQILLDNISEGTQIVKLLFDDQGTPIDYEYLAVNSVYANFLGYDKEEFTGKRATDFLSNIEPEWFIKYEEILKSGRAQRFEMYNNTLGCWFDVLAIPLGELHTFAIIHTNISERKEMEKEIQKYRNRYQELLETNADFIWEMDVNGVYTYCSPQMERLWGLKPENMIGKVMGVKMTPDGRKEAYDVYRNAVNSGSQIIGFESTTYDEQGNLSYFEILTMPFSSVNFRAFLNILAIHCVMRSGSTSTTISCLYTCSNRFIFFSSNCDFISVIASLTIVFKTTISLFNTTFF